MKCKMRTPPNITEEQLRACLQNQYGLVPVTFEFLPLGLDYNAGVYRVASEQGAACLLKVTSRPLYEPRCLVPRYLNDQGITSVVAPIPTMSGTLWARMEEWNVIVYPFIEGDTRLTGMASAQWQEVGGIFRQIHQVALPSEGFETLRRETFDPTGYIRWVHVFEIERLHSRHSESESTRALLADWQALKPTIHTALATLEKLAEVLQARGLPYGISDADLHAANLLRDHAGHVFVIDWDEVMLAPKERDFIFIREPHADAFFQGYGQQEIDWVALTYYLWERVVQDVIEDAQNVCFRDDWEEETRADATRLLYAYLSSGSTIIAASDASAHLPKDLYDFNSSSRRS